MPYTYPPSEHILHFGEIENGTHYYCEGIAIFDDENLRSQKCKFEVAYTQNSQVVVVCYFSDKFVDLWATDGGTRAYYNCERIIGCDIKNGQIVSIEQLRFRSSNTSSGGFRSCSRSQNLVL